MSIRRVVRPVDTFAAAKHQQPTFAEPLIRCS